MKWEQLYSNKRTGSESKSSGNNDAVRTSFLRDYDRIIFSSAFRRLQNKTQVFPLPGPVFVHNRLTHSLEVASVGRSLGKAVGDALVARYPHKGEDFTEFYKYELAAVIAAGCLAHDIGNPPFGHSGEDAIRTFFRDLEGDSKERFETLLTPNQQRDFLYFEGNANAFRTLTHHFNEDAPGGFRLTYATLASIIKYPADSVSGFNKKQLITKKSGFFDSEIGTYKKIAEEFQIPKMDDNANVYARHPFVYLVEAADDICYRIIDFEDAHRLNIISIDTIKELFLSFFDQKEGYESKEKVESSLNKIKDDNQKVSFLRARLINLLINRICQVFMEKETELLEGTLSKSLIDYLGDDELALMKHIDDYSVKHIYNHRSVVEIEIAGYNVIGGLLKEFFAAIIEQRSSKSKKVLQLISPQFVISGEPEKLYNDIQSVVDFISGMTDLYAVDIYRKITGISMPQLR
ncbi:deoxyguanosinetriphosphate triphosphohydrolase [Pseudoflavitalea sp. G-6-1-2]|uniref:deoxyguanosinetriphosphate triphosphohydrolase n=1 Tax=Pseudoflavitalea sp. G-6-1-2 TaxID=2728841 RepID=UPI00146A029E|nr:deoxyguanosinetriphosphate triphosphohydrolase [Pseudoflavitalea sp. G-6-1-2]NML19637.1 deoxyguanosinetriphosphate triphosphohydrolase [Pseudoflavitalea sp. G-6-1-2]